MATREWMITKVVGLLLGLFMLVSSGIGAANLITSIRRDVDRNEKNIEKHVIGDEKKWDDINEDIETLEDDIHSLELQGERTEANQKEILRRIDEYHSDLKNFMNNFEAIE